jgi:prepilin-type N-terminal cleavage/methylation domain-containing protein
MDRGPKEEGAVTKQLRGRTGFTLLELVIVIGIIAILVALSMAAVMKVRVLGMVKSSSDVVEKVQAAVDNQYKAIIAQAQKDIKGGGITPDAAAMYVYAGNDQDLALALLTYCRVRQSFPQSFSEVAPFTVGGYTFPVKQQFQAYAGTSLPWSQSTATLISQQSAALLYAATAQTGAGGNTFNSDEATNSAKSTVVIGTGSYPVYIDAFQTPIGYCRFGTNRELQLSPYANTKSACLDPLDPAGKLLGLNATTQTQLGLAFFLNNGDPANAVVFGTNRIPVVYSCGYNKFYESLDNAGVNIQGIIGNDDILGYRLRQLGQVGVQNH